MDSCTILDPAFRPPEILELIELDVTDEFTSVYTSIFIYDRSAFILSIPDYLADVTVDAVDCALGYAPVARDAISFKCFVRDTIRRASVQMPVLLITLVYITRSKPFLCIEVDQWACERVFLGALIVASKVCSLIFPWRVFQKHSDDVLTAHRQRYLECSMVRHHRCFWETRRG